MAQDPLLAPHAVHIALGSDRVDRADAYRRWLYASLDPDEIARIRVYMQQEKAMGGVRFQAMVEKALNRNVGARPRGRPRGVQGVEVV